MVPIIQALGCEWSTCDGDKHKNTPSHMLIRGNRVLISHEGLHTPVMDATNPVIRTKTVQIGDRQPHRTQRPYNLIEESSGAREHNAAN